MPWSRVSTQPHFSSPQTPVIIAKGTVPPARRQEEEGSSDTGLVTTPVQNCRKWCASTGLGASPKQLFMVTWPFFPYNISHPDELLKII